jgi:hypothetical protein
MKRFRSRSRATPNQHRSLVITLIVWGICGTLFLVDQLLGTGEARPYRITDVQELVPTEQEIRRSRQQSVIRFNIRYG